MTTTAEQFEIAEMDATLACKSLAHFVRQSWHILEPTTPLIWNWHIEAICLHVQSSLEGWIEAQQTGITPVIQNLLINVPPGSMKSRIVAVCAPAWMWLRSPSWRAIFISANPRVSIRDSSYCRDLLESQWYRNTFQPEWDFAPDQNAKGLYRNNCGGFRMAISVGARITGDRADALIVDDPLDAAEANSEASRRNVTEWWDQGAANRVNDLKTSLRIAIMQRLHEDDFSGHVLKEGGWEHLCIPQEYETETTRETAIGWSDPRATDGELMFTERFPPAVLAIEKRRLGSGGYAGQHQQRPAPAEGGKFKRAWIRYFTDADTHYILHCQPGDPSQDRRILKAECMRFNITDTAFSSKQTADYTASGTFDRSPTHDLIWFDLVRERMQDPEVKATLRSILTSLKPAWMGIENKQNGATAIQEFIRDGLPIRAIKADTDKVTRATTATIYMENGKVYLPKDAPWLVDVEKELLLFPNASHDDCVDVLSNACISLANESPEISFPTPHVEAYHYGAMQ
jgi:predicted phage terminase large subunit-like protein